MQTDVFISMDCQHMFGHPNQHRPKYRVPICGQFGYFDLGLCHSYWCYTGHLFSHLYRCPIKFHQDPSKLIMLYDSGGSSKPQHSTLFFTESLLFTCRLVVRNCKDVLDLETCISCENLNFPAYLS
jgi:hypothetical protein